MKERRIKQNFTISTEVLQEFDSYIKEGMYDRSRVIERLILKFNQGCRLTTEKDPSVRKAIIRDITLDELLDAIK